MSTEPEPSRAVPSEVRAYLAELVRRTRAVCGPRLTGIVAVGSLALGDYRHGRSDVDVTVVVEELPAAALRELADALAHRRLPCPAVARPATWRTSTPGRSCRSGPPSTRPADRRSGT
ncbi:nucleotidyltransferase domain-containing protein [Streptomyces sennicomposti]